jgi:hypothetical protein
MSMKKNVLLSVFSLLAILVNAQPSLTWVRPPFGTTKTYNMYRGSIAEPSVGADQVWDYSALTPTNIGVGVYTDPAILPASAKDKFPTATYVEVWNYPMAPSLDLAIIDYYYDCADSLVRLGQQGSGGNLANTWGDVQGIWKIAFGDSVNARYGSNSTSKLVTGSFKYAAYGTLKTKYGIYDNVVMFTHPDAKVFFQTTPYFGMLMNVVYSDATTIAGAYIYSYSGSTGVEGLTSSKKVNIYSTLKNNEIVIDIDGYKGNCAVKVINLLGKTVYQNVLIFNADKQTLSLNNVNKGIYLVEIRYNNEVQTAKVLLTK